MFIYHDHIVVVEVFVGHVGGVARPGVRHDEARLWRGLGARDDLCHQVAVPLERIVHDGNGRDLLLR